MWFPLLCFSHAVPSVVFLKYGALNLALLQTTPRGRRIPHEDRGAPTGVSGQPEDNHAAYVAGDIQGARYAHPVHDQRPQRNEPGSVPQSHGAGPPGDASVTFSALKGSTGVFERGGGK